jgi:hypothetical protein
MNTARWQATATLLPNGKVLIAGGTSGYTTLNGLASTELYDPTTNAVAVGPAMIGGRSGRLSATATLLPDGKVLIAGGSTQHLTDLYDAYANSFAPAAFQPALNDSYSAATATLLPNGKVLIAGGIGDGGGAISSTELYDPATNTVAAGPTMSAARISATATFLPNGKLQTDGVQTDGKVLIAGGELGADGGFKRLNSTELYDPATNTFAAGPAMNTARGDAAATLLPNGKVLIAGGAGQPVVLNSTELYDPATNTFGASNPMNAARFDAAIVVLPDSRVLITGGFGSDSSALSSTELYTE